MSGIHCKHYDGREILVFDGKCRAGIDPRASFCGGNDFGMIKKIPCLKTNTDAPPCEHMIFPTPEEVAADDAAFEAQVADFMMVISTVRPAIEAEHKATGAWSGHLECPKCSKPLHWAKAECNGHVHARCETDNCVAWME